MYSRITEFQVKIEKIEQGIELYRKSVVPASKEQKGYVKTLGMIDRLSGKGISLTIWQSEEDALASEKNLYYQKQLIKFLNFLEKPAYTRDFYEIVIDD